MKNQKSEKQIRFEQEAKALQKNLEKRKKQKLERETFKKSKDSSYGQN